VQYKTCGHTKGVVLWDGRLVGWLVHSVPKWPCHDTRSPSGVGSRGLSEIEDSQIQKAQSFIWVALPAAALPTVLRQVEHMQVGAQTGGWVRFGSCAAFLIQLLLLPTAACCWCYSSGAVIHLTAIKQP
jgi:hypothetical protein